MARKICTNPECTLGKSVTTFDVSEEQCSYCKGHLVLRNEEFNLDDDTLSGYENFTNSNFDNPDYEKDNREIFVKYFSFIGDEYFNRENWDKSLLYYEKAISVLNNNYQLEVIENLENKLGCVYIKINKPVIAIEHFYRCLKIQESIYDKQELLISWTHTNIAHAYFLSQNYEEAIFHNKKAINILTLNENPDYDKMVTLNIRIGNAFRIILDFKNALYHFNEALIISNKYLNADNAKISCIYSLMGESYANIGDFENATFCFENELRNAVPFFEDIDLAYIYWKLGNCYKELKNFEKAINVFVEGFKKSNNKSGGFPFLIGNCYEAINKPKNAIEYYLIASDIRIKELGLTAKETIQAVNYYNRLAIELGNEYLDVNDYKPNR